MNVPHIVIARVSRLLNGLRPTKAQQLDDGWFKLKGGSLELAGTGFQIRHELRRDDNDVARAAFVAYDPEGHFIAFTHQNLPGLKALCEQQARARQEFDL